MNMEKFDALAEKITKDGESQFGPSMTDVGPILREMRFLLRIADYANEVLGDSEGPSTPAEARMMLWLGWFDYSNLEGKERCPCGERDTCDECATTLELRLAVAKLAASDNQPMLWCCHVRGPDDVHAARDYAHALEIATEINALSAKANADHPNDPVLCEAAPAPWPWSAETHAADLAKGQHA